MGQRPVLSSSSLILDEWRIDIQCDEDRHLNLYVSHEDGTMVHDCDADLSGDDWLGVRFTSEGIETEYDNWRNPNEEITR